jgi:GTP-binding protein HflX
VGRRSRIDKESKNPTLNDVAAKEETTLLVGFKELKNNLLGGKESLEELHALANTAGAIIKQELMLKINNPDPSFYLGRGKVEELALIVQQEDIDLVIFDDELSPRQQHNLEDHLDCRVIDRTALILHIFAQRAKTKEGKLQVELAQLKYLLPRLRGIGTELSRLGGGIGTRGPGETKLESDRRHIRRRIGELQKKIAQIKKQRGIIRQKRTQEEIPVVALVGYTNAGKSTILNTLTGADALAENKLFATLDPTTRKLTLGQEDVLLTDTVGFIHKLPHQLIAAFRATLEEIKYADLLLHVVDASNPAIPAQIKTVNRVLKELDSLNKPTIMVFNKWDLVQDPLELHPLINRNAPAIAISAAKNYQLDELLNLISANLPAQPQLVHLLLPFAQSNLTGLLYQAGKVAETEYREEGIYCAVYLTEQYVEQFKDYMLPTSGRKSSKEGENTNGQD